MGLFYEPGAVMIYLDANATTSVDPVVLEAMLPFLQGQYGNPSAAHAAGRAARRALEKARGEVAALIAAETEEVIFTSGGTESINTVHQSVQKQWPDRPLLIVSAVDHSATLECASRWAEQGGRVKFLPVDECGVVSIQTLESALEPGLTALVSVLWGNNETGVLQPMREIVDCAHEVGALVHADAVQVAGKWPVSVQDVPVDYLSLSGHKMHAPKGVGALFVSRRVGLLPLLVGGGQEAGRRCGTENVPGIVALGAAARLAREFPQTTEIGRLRDDFEAALEARLPGLMIHGRRAARLPNTSSIYFPEVEGAGLLIRLDQKGLACSGGSACHAGALHPSHVLEAMGYNAAHAGRTLRFSLSRHTTEADIVRAVDLITAAVAHLREQWGGDSLLM